MPERELWRCPKCREEFTTRNQWHSCGKFDLETLFAKSEDHVRELYEGFVAVIDDCGGAKIIPQKSRIAFQVRMRFAALMPQRRALKGHLVLSEKHDEPCFLRVDSYSVGNHVHVFRLESLDDLNEQFIGWVREAYRVGKQEHLK